VAGIDVYSGQLPRDRSVLFSRTALRAVTHAKLRMATSAKSPFTKAMIRENRTFSSSLVKLLNGALIP
jgi:hypothetical protein